MNKIPNHKTAIVWLISPHGFRYTGVIVEMDDSWVILRDSKTGSDLCFIRENVDKIVFDGVKQ